MVKIIYHRIKMSIIMSDVKYKKSHSLPKGAEPQIEITFIILTSVIKMKQIQIMIYTHLSCTLQVGSCGRKVIRWQNMLTGTLENQTTSLEWRTVCSRKMMHGMMQTAPYLMIVASILSMVFVKWTIKNMFFFNNVKDLFKSY